MCFDQWQTSRFRASAPSDLKIELHNPFGSKGLPRKVMLAGTVLEVLTMIWSFSEGFV